MATLNNVSSPTGYSPAAEIVQPGSARVTLVVANAAVYYQIGRGRPGVIYGPDEVLALPGFYSLSRSCDGFRFRSAVPAAPALVTVQLLDAGELGPGE